MFIRQSSTFMTTHLFQFGFPDAEHYRHPSWLLTLTFFTNQVQPQLDLLRCGHELRLAGVHGWLQVAAIETAVSKQTSSFPNGQFQHHHSSVVLVLMCSLSLLVWVVLSNIGTQVGWSL